MKIKFTLGSFLVVAILFSKTVSAQSAGDYRSVVASGLWSAVSTWQTFDGTSWVAASATPTSSDGVITIQNTDSIILDIPITIDQVVIQHGGILAIFNTSVATTVTLNDNPSSDDIIIDGKLYISIFATLSGSGSVLNNNDGLMTLRFSGTLAANLTNNGEMDISQTGNIQSATVTNNSLLVWLDNNISLSTANIINNGTVDIKATGDAFIIGSGGTFTNALSSSVIFMENSTARTVVNAVIAFTNNGIVKGAGEYDIPNTVSQIGIISPGNNSSAALTVDPFFVGGASGRTPTVNMELSSAGAVAGTNYDQLIFSMNFPTSVTGVSLNVTSDNAVGDPVGTVYTLMISPLNTITGPLASVTLPPSLGNLTYTTGNPGLGIPGTITVTRLIALPLIWGSFVAQASNNQTILYWNTFDEINTSHFLIQHSLDGQNFTTIGTLPAKGSDVENAYTFTHSNPNLNATNYYRLSEIDLDGKTFYSAIRSVRFNNGQVVAVQIGPNPVQNLLQVNVQVDDVTVQLYDMSGRLLKNMQLDRGFYQVSLQNFATGTYQVAIYQKQKLISTQLLLKQ